MKKFVLFIFAVWFFAMFCGFYGGGGTSGHGEIVKVSGVTRAVKYSDGAGDVVRVDLFHDSAVADYGDASTVGSINWAIGQITNRGLVRLHPGTYEVQQSILLQRTGIIIEGEGIGSAAYPVTGIKLADGAFMSELDGVVEGYADDGESWYFCGLRNLIIDGNDDNNDYGACLWTHTDGSGEFNDFFVDRVFFRNGKQYGVFCNYSWGYRFSGFLVEYCDQIGFYLTGGQAYIARFFIAYNGRHGMQLPVEVGLFTQGRVYQNGWAGIDCAGSRNSFSLMSIEDNNEVAASSRGQVNIAGDYTTFSDFYIKDADADGAMGDYGIRVTGDYNKFNSGHISIDNATLGSEHDILITADAIGTNINQVTYSTLSDLGTGSLINPEHRHYAVADLQDAATPSVLTSAETTNKTISNYKATGADHVFTLPAAHKYGDVTFTVGDEFQVDIEPPSGTAIYLNGTAAASDEHIVNIADTLGDEIRCHCVNINGALTWMCNSENANWTEATP